MYLYYSNALVLLTVLDVNDQPPQFTEGLYRLDVDEDTPINTRFPLITANDDDTPPNSIITYSADITSKSH